MSFRITAATMSLMASLSLADTALAETTVQNAWVRATAGSGKVSAGYGTIINTGPDADQLLYVSTPVAMMTELHQSKSENGIMSMEPVDALPISSGGKVELKPGGYHLMIMKLTQSLEVGETIELVFTFKKQGVVKATAKVVPLSANGPD
jgi:hypothetical protein